MQLKMKNFEEFLTTYSYKKDKDLFSADEDAVVSEIELNNEKVKIYINEFWTARQRQANSIHEISYRACFKPQLPRFFIEYFTKEGDSVYDPFTGRGTTIIEAALLNREIVSNDINPISTIFCKSRLFAPSLKKLAQRLEEIKIFHDIVPEIDLSMFYEKKTLDEILSLKKYFKEKEEKNTLDKMDLWIRMVATNRLTGHSKGFFSVYTLPPNQAVTAERQAKINLQRSQTPEYRDVKKIIIKKTKDLIKDITEFQKNRLEEIGKKALFLNCDARYTNESIKENSIDLTVTSPPFLDVVQYASDNWLRCWFNNINADEISSKITMSKTIEDWENVMGDVFKELYRITKINGYIAFEVGEVRNGKIKLEEHVHKLGTKSGFKCLGIMINEQQFTKTANIWGVSNNSKGTNSNRIVIFQKEKEV
jgi:DNA modification methylase